MRPKSIAAREESGGTLRTHVGRRMSWGGGHGRWADGPPDSPFSWHNFLFLPLHGLWRRAIAARFMNRFQPRREAGASQAERCFPSRCHLLGNPRYLKRSFVAKHRPVEACVVATATARCGAPSKRCNKKKNRLATPDSPHLPEVAVYEQGAAALINDLVPDAVKGGGGLSRFPDQRPRGRASQPHRPPTAHDGDRAGTALAASHPHLAVL